MTYTFNNLNAHDIKNIVIAREDAFRAVKYEDLSFHDKCKYLYEYDNLKEHPSIQDRSFVSVRLAELKPELERLAAADDAIGLFYLAALSNESECDRAKAEEYIKRAAYKCYVPAALKHIQNKMCSGIDDETYQLADSLEDFFYQNHEDEVERLRGLITCHLAFYEYHSDGSMENILGINRRKLAPLGSFSAILDMLDCARSRIMRASYSEEELVAERDFWQTVVYLVLDHYASLGITRHYINLSNMLMKGIGCEKDRSRAGHLVSEAIIARMGALSEAGIAEIKAKGNALAEVRLFIARIIDAFIARDGETIRECVAKLYSIDLASDALIAHSIISLAVNRPL